MRDLWPYYRPYRWTLVVVVLGSILGAGLEISIPMFLRQILETVLPQGDLPGLVQQAGILLGLSLLCLLAVVALKTLDTIVLNQRMKDAFQRARARTGTLSGRATQMLQAIRLVKAFGNEVFALAYIRKASEDLRTAQQRTLRYEACLMSTIVFFSQAANLVIIGFGTWLIMRGTMRMGDLVAFLLYLMMFLRPVMQLTMLTERCQRSMAGLTRCREVLCEPQEALDAPGAKELERTQVQGRIVFSHVDFSYDAEKPVLQDFSLAIAPGETVAIVSPGAGKSTLAHLLLRFYEPSRGCIRLDGAPLRAYTLRSLRRAIGLVQQDVMLFDASVRDNIAFGRPGATEADIVRAARQADADDFIRALPQGYASGVGEQGVRLSGGQRQRIALARIFLKDPPILILDEATSALDAQTEQEVRQALQRLAAQRTTLVIAHRLSTVRHADRIVVLTMQGIAEMGRHEDLMAKRGAYYELCKAQE